MHERTNNTLWEKMATALLIVYKKDISTALGQTLHRTTHLEHPAPLLRDVLRSGPSSVTPQVGNTWVAVAVWFRTGTWW